MQLPLVMSEQRLSRDTKQMYNLCHMFYTNVGSFGTFIGALTVCSDGKRRAQHLTTVYISSLNSKATQGLF